MITSDTVRARIDSDTKASASKALAAMGLSVSDAIRMMLRRVADEKRLPFEVKVPNVESKAAIKELESGKGKTFKSADALFDDLGI
jgi:DNA-damage-inducible protein J